LLGGLDEYVAELVNRTTKEEMKNCMWLKPQLIAQIEFTEWTPDGHLRHSKFVGLREDKESAKGGARVRKRLSN
jgi:ATP-dependent DNA ligase